MLMLGPVGELSAEGTEGAVPFWAVFLVLLGAVLTFSLVYAWRYGRTARRRQHHAALNRKAQRAAEAVVMPLLIERLDTLSEHSTAEPDLERSAQESSAAREMSGESSAHQTGHEGSMPGGT